MLFYIIYILIFKIFINLINIKSIYLIINTIFYNVNNKAYFIAILLGILIKGLISISKKFKIKNVFKLSIFIIIDIIKTVLNFNIYFVLISVLISLIFTYFESKNIYFQNKIFKIILYICYISAPITPIYIIKNHLNNKLPDEIILIPSIITLIIIIGPYNIINIDTKTLIGVIIIGLLSFNINNFKNKKRNIVPIFLIISYLIYYIVLS